ncbi:hypothetical protein VE03_08629 [Pseudogymnoascus sp. 23342-1-I1]|nr:hypothetical protein VE03_08629 [Pseudogymnoascus sp. 23342-1-I1]
MAEERLSQVSGQLKQIPPVHSATGKYTVSEEPLGTARHVRVVCIGAGASGINLIRTLRKQVTIFDLVVYEKNEDIGGTWFENRYPGCKCDIPSHNYHFSWLPNPEWKEFYSSATEIQDYLQQCCGKEKLYDSIKTSHRVDHAEWNDSEGVWSLRIVDEKSGKQFHDYCHFLLDGMGILNNWTWPDIPGLHDFNGPLIHSANWPKDFNYDGLPVAVIGNGATGVQIVPAILPDVKHMVHVVRSPSWIAPPGLVNLSYSNAASILSKIDIDENGNFTTAQIQKFKELPEDYLTFVKAIELETNQNFSKIMIKDSDSQAITRGMIQEYMRNMLNNDEVLCKAFIPDFPLGCRRLTPGVGYLEALQDPKVDIVTDAIKRVVPNGIMTSTGKLLKVDAIICVTGFDVSFRPRFPIIGRKGTLQDIWSREVPKAYMSCAVTGMPNYFIFLGPNAPIGHGSYFTITEHIAKYIACIITKCQTQGIKSIAPSESAVNDYFEHTQEFMPRTTWSGNCRSWFKQGKKDGPVVALHPGSRIHFFDMLRDFRGEDWVFTYQASNQGNRFRYVGNGISARELDGSDCTWYLDEPDKLS